MHDFGLFPRRVLPHDVRDLAILFDLFGLPLTAPSFSTMRHNRTKIETN
jgi:hypothetical protein